MARTLKYLDSFARLKSEDQIRAVEKLLNNCQELAKFERAQLGESTGSTGCTILTCLYRKSVLRDGRRSQDADSESERQD